MLKTKNSRQSFFLPLILGLASFLLLVGPSVLNPRNIAWLLSGFDMTLEYLGWAFYRYGPWTFPIGMNPQFGLDISSSIIYSNSLPLIAPFFKLLSPWLGDPFQFWGFWLMGCFILQAWMAWKLLSLVSNSVSILILSTSLFLFSPPMLYQIGFHNSTVAMFPLLAAWYLILRPDQERRILWWTILLPCTLLIHPYTFAMVLVLWLGDVLDRLFIQKMMSLFGAAQEFICVFGVTILFAWQAGYFQSISPGETGFGMYRMNLLALFDPSGFDSQNWSYLYQLPKVRANNNYEGFSYLGLGIIWILLMAIPAILSFRKHFSDWIKKYIFVCCAMLGCTLFALSNQVAIGSWAFTIPLNSTLFSLASILRASGRMFWPVFYFILFLGIFFVIRSYSRKITITILAIGLSIQVIDTSPAWLEKKMALNTKPANLGLSLDNPFWDAAGQYYKNIVRVPVWNEQVIWEKFASFAAKHHLGTNSVFMGRVDNNKIIQSNQRMQEVIQSGQFATDTLYVVEDSEISKFLTRMNPQTDLIARINEINVFAPGWKKCSTCIAVPVELEIDPKISTERLIKLGEKIDLSQFGKYAKSFLISGWSVPEKWGTWSMGNTAVIQIPLSALKPQGIKLDAQAFISTLYPSQEIEIWVNGRYIKKENCNKRSGNLIDIPLKGDLTQSGPLKIEFKLPNAISPKALGIGSDTRPLAIGIESLRYY